MRSPGLRTVGAISCFTALLLMLGAHWHLLQSVAWARMLAGYARSGTVREAIDKTFDGQHPCALCLQVRDGRRQQEKEQRKSPWVKPERAPDLFVENRSVWTPLRLTAATLAVAFVPRWSPDFIESPPKPPPRGIDRRVCV